MKIYFHTIAKLIIFVRLWTGGGLFWPCLGESDCNKLKYNKKWDAENCKKVTIKMRKADYEIFNKYVTDNGFSKNGYIINLIKKDLQEKCPPCAASITIILSIKLSEQIRRFL